MTNVFVLCTGRCGSTTFIKAAAHATNFTATHESRCYLTGKARLAYPPRHIEADNRLSWMLGRLDATYGDSAHYVHLLREPAAVAASFIARKDVGIMKAYRQDILLGLPKFAPDTPIEDVAFDMIETVTTNIRSFLRDKTKVTELHLETAAEDFPRFWHGIGAQGDLDAAMTEWEIRHNATVRKQT